MLNGKNEMIMSFENIIIRLVFFREMIDEQTDNGPRFCSEQSSSGGPDRIKHESYRSSPYSYPQSQRKSSPTNGMKTIHSLCKRNQLINFISLVPPYRSSSTSPFDLSTYYAPTPIANIPCSSSSALLSDNTAYYSNTYYSSPSSYYFPHGTSSSVAHYPFITSFGYPLNNNPNLDTASFFHMQPPMGAVSTDNNHLTPLLPLTTDIEQY